jgi:TRAP-type uncharacterized transport system substrate-binding protein
VAQGGVFPFTVGLVVRDKSNIKQVSDLKGKRMAWDFGGHAINQTWQSAMMEMGGVKGSDVTQVRFSNLNEAVRGVAEGKVDSSIVALGIGLVEEVNAMEPVRFINLPNTEAANKILSPYGVAELETLHPLFKRWNKEHQALNNFTIPYHPGAVKFYKEVGVWTAKHDARTKEICS